MSFQKQIAQSLVWRGLYFLTILIMNIFLSRYFEAGNAGWIFYLCNNFSFLVILFGITIENGVNYYASRKEIAYDQLAWFSILWSAFVALVAFAALWIYFGRYRDTTAITRAEYLYYAVCYIAGIQLTNLFTVLFYARKNFFLPNCIMVLLNVMVIWFIPKQVGTFATNSHFIIYLYFGFFVLTGLALAGAYILANKSWKNFALPGLKSTKFILRYAAVALLANVVFFLVYRVDYWFVKKYCSPEALGNYIQVSKLVQMLLIVPSIISSVVFPHIAGGMLKSEMKNNILHIGRISTLLLSVLFIFILAGGRWLFPFVFGQSFQLMYYPFCLLLPGIWALSNLSILSAYFGGTNQLSVNVTGASIALIFILAGDIIFIPRYGIAGAAVVSSVGYSINFAYAFLHMRREHQISFNDYWLIRKADFTWIKNVLQHR